MYKNPVTVKAEYDPFCKIFLLVTSISLISVSLFGKEDTEHVGLRDRTFVSFVTGLQLLSLYFIG